MDGRVSILLLIFVGKVAALYSGLCKPDAENACHDYSSADKCQLLEYCKSNVWSDVVASESKFCQVCKADIANVEKFISSNTTREFVKYDLLALCRTFPFAAPRNECRAIIEDNFDKIYDDIVLKLDPNTICRALHICRSSDHNEDSSSVDGESLGPMMLPGPVRIKDDICFTAEKCSNYNMAVKCGSLDLCKESIWLAPVQTSPICDECKAEIKKIHDWVADNKTEDEVKKELLMFCDQIPIPNLQQKCHNMIALNFEAVYKDIIAFLDSNIICSALGLCVPSYEIQTPLSCELDAAHACLNYASAAHCNTLNYCQYVVWNTAVENDKLCTCCLNGIDKVREHLDSNRTRERVEADFLAICKLLPWQSVRFQCQTTVLHNFERIYQDVINYLNSTIICRALFLCRNQGHHDALADAFLNVIMKYDSEDDSLECRFCKGQIKALQDWIKSSPTKDAVNKRLLEFCSDIKLTAFREECQSMVDEHFDEIYSDLISETDPDFLCKKLKICEAAKNEISTELCTGADPCSDYDTAKKCGALAKCKKHVWSKPVVQGDNICRFCEGQIKALQDFIKDNATEAEVKQSLTAFCNDLKLSAFKDECLSFMDNNFDDLYADLIALLDASTVCTYLKLCNEITLKRKEILNDATATASCRDELACDHYTSAIKCGKLEKCKATVWAIPTVQGSNICNLCKEEITVLQKWLQSKPVADQVKDAMLSFCDGIPLTAFRTECEDNVNTNFDEIHADLTNMVNQGVICTGMKLCTGIPAEKYAGTMMDRLPNLLKKAMKERKLPVSAPFANKLLQIEGGTCKRCESFVDDFQNIVFNNNEIMEALLELIKPECESLDGNGAMCDMISYQMKMEHGRQPANPIAVCKASNMCYVGDKFTDDICTNCKAFFKQLQEEMKSNPTFVHGIVHTVSEFYCLRKSHQLRKQCVKYLTMVIDVMLKAMEVKDVSIICKRVQFCGVTQAVAHDWKEFVRMTSKAIVEGMPRRLEQLEGEPCADCKAFVTDLQTAIKNKDPIVTELVNLVEGQCRTLGKLSSVCVNYIKGHYQDILNQFTALTVDQVCDAMRMCPKSQNAVNGDICTDCKAFFDDWQNLIVNNRSLVNQDLSDLENALCSDVPFFLKGECKKIFDEESGVIVTALSSQTSDQTCSDLMFCDNVEPKDVLPAAVEDSEVKVEIPVACGVCEAVMTYIDSYIDYNTTEKELDDLLRKVCAELPEFGKQCDDFVKNYADQIIKLILEEGTSPTVVCKLLGLCAAPPAPPKKIVNGPAECDVCIFVFTEIQHALANKELETDIVNELSKICNVIGKYKAECELLVNDYGPTLIKILANEVKPSTVCGLIKLCKPSEAPKIPQLPQKKVDSGALCDVCTLVAAQLDVMLSEKSTQTEIENALETVCGFLPGNFKKTCDDFIAANFQTIMNFLVTEMNPKVICVLLKVCPAQEKVTSGVLCDVCTLVAAQLDAMLSEKSTKDEIKNALKTVCGLLPGEFKETCDDLIAANFQAIVDFLVDEMNPKKICIQIHVCPAQEKVKSGILCDVCTQVAAELDRMLSDKSTQADIKSALDMVCNFLPGDLKTTCDGFINTYFDEIMAILVKEMNPKVICVQLKVCPALVTVTAVDKKCEVCKLAAGTVDDLLKEPDMSLALDAAMKELCHFLPTGAQASCQGIMDQASKEIFTIILKEMVPDVFCSDMGFCTKVSEKASSDAECDVCTLAMTYLDKELADNATETEIETALEKFCGILPTSYKTECDNLITEYGQMIFQLLIEELKPSEICAKLGLCPATVKRVIPQSPQISNDAVTCEVCTLAMGYLDKMLSDNATETEIESALEKVCGLLPATYKTECDNLITEYGQMIFQFLIKELKPSVICAKLGLCSATVKRVIPQSPQIPNGVVTCEVCTLAMGYLDKMLSDNATETEIESALEKVCGLLPATYKTECDNLITEYGQMIFQFLIKELKPSVICAKLGLCSATVKRVIPQSPQISNDAVTCEICTLAMGYLDKMLSDNATETEIESALEKVCGLLPATYKTECDNLITEYGKAIFDILIQELNPSKVCAELGLCSSTASSVTPSKALEFPGECFVCDMIMNELDKVLSEESTEKEILAAVTSVCDIVSGEYRDYCKLYINDYGPGVIAILVRDFVPDQVCAKLHMCAAKMKTTHKQVMKLHVGDEKCSICRAVIIELDNILDSNRTEAAVEHALDVVCDELPSALQSECEEFVAEYTPTIMKYIDNIADPGFICEHLHLCPTETKEAQILGGDKCTYGPSYWCRDMETAKACQAVEHCMNHVW